MTALRLYLNTEAFDLRYEILLGYSSLYPNKRLSIAEECKGLQHMFILFVTAIILAKTKRKEVI